MAMRISTKYFWFGILTMALGVVALLNAALTSLAIVSVTGVFLLISGAAQIFLGFSADRVGTKALTWLLGALSLLLGWSFIANPLAGAVSLSTLILILFAVGGLVQIAFAFRVRDTRLFWPLIIAGLLSLVLAVVVLSSPEASFVLLGVLLGIQMLSAGASLTMWGMALKEAAN